MSERHISCISSCTLFQTIMSVTETLYRHKDILETIFRIFDKDNSGFISMAEFEEACSILMRHATIPLLESQISDVARSLDLNNDGHIDFNEFLEAFRIVDQDSLLKSPDSENIIDDGIEAHVAEDTPVKVVSTKGQEESVTSWPWAGKTNPRGSAANWWHYGIPMTTALFRSTSYWGCCQVLDKEARDEVQCVSRASQTPSQNESNRAKYQWLLTKWIFRGCIFFPKNKYEISLPGYKHTW